MLRPFWARRARLRRRRHQHNRTAFQAEFLETRVMLAADLAPAIFGGWDDSLIYSTVAGTNTTASSVTTADTVFVDLGWGNFGDTTVPGNTFSVQLQLDGTPIVNIGTSFDLPPFTGAVFQDWNLGQLTAGPHTITMIVDVNNTVVENSEVNNIRQRTFTVTSPGTDDFGDAPTAAQSGFASSYPTLLADGGARHGVLSGFHLGGAKDLEVDGQPSLQAAGDDASGSPDDEDGVTFSGPFVVGSTASFDVSLTNTAGAANPHLDVWLDFNRDGDWLDAGESVFSGNISGNTSIPFTVDPAASFGSTYARFRLYDGTAPLTPGGAAASGEVEDYLVTLAAPGSWVPLGPFSATDGQVENVLPNDEVVGAVHTALAHPTNPDILYIGGTNGGVWKTTNATAASPSWTSLTDGLPSQSIGSMTFDRGDATFNTIYAGVGRYSSFGRIGNDRVGLLRTTDGGLTWSVVDGGGILAGKNISGVHANGNTIVVSVNVADSFTYANIGIFRSTDGGATFTQISGGNGSATGLPGGASYDLVVDPTNPNILYTSAIFADGVGGLNGIYKSIDQGATWTKVSSSAIDALLTSSSATSNLELAVGTSNNVYAAVINTGALAGLFRSGDGGSTWVQMDTPATNENGTNVGLNPSGGTGPGPGASAEEIAGGQGAIHFSMLADPTNPNIVYVGGDRQPRSFGDTGSFPNSIGAMDFTGRLFRGDASAPVGSQFVHLTHSSSLGAAGGGTASSSAPHADSREMVFDANGNIIEADDGGIFRRTSPQNNTGDWFSLNGNLQVTEVHDVAWDAVSNITITGNQDTGTTFQPLQGATTWDSLHTGDGGDVSVDDITLAGSGQSIRYTSFQNLSNFRRTTWDSSGNLISTAFPARTVISGPSFTPAFRTPVELNALNPQRLILQGSNGAYESLNQGNSIAQVGAGASVSGIDQNAIAYGGRKNGVDNEDVLWVGAGSNVYFRSGPGALALTSADPTTQTIRDLAMDPDDWASAFIIDADQVFSTFNQGGSWSDITGNLLSTVTNLFSISYVAGPVVDALLVGTNLGVFAAATTALGAWVQVGGNLPNVLVYDMEYDAADDVLVAGTLGRGVWSMSAMTDLLETIFAAPVPEFVSASINNGSANRSGIAEIDLTFSEAVTISAATDLNLFNHTTASSISLGGATLINNSTTLITLDLSGVSLPDGRYTLELPASAALNGSSVPLAATVTIAFHKLAGDANGSGSVNAGDFSDVTTNFSTPPGDPYRTGDTTGDGLVNASDFSPITSNFSNSLPALALDFGDAPDPTFLTLLASNGARHVITGNSLRLGATRDSESDGQPDAGATGDGADEDGVSITGGALETETAVNVDVNASGSGVLNVWIDYNQDGDWDDAGEHVVDDLAIATGTTSIGITAPLGSQGTAIARFRLTSTGGYSYDGLAPNGEVEDYAITINNATGPAAAPLLVAEPQSLTTTGGTDTPTVPTLEGSRPTSPLKTAVRRGKALGRASAAALHSLALTLFDGRTADRPVFDTIGDSKPSRLSLIGGDAAANEQPEQPAAQAASQESAEPGRDKEKPIRGRAAHRTQ